MSMPLLYRLLADAVVVVHAAYVLFVLAGFVLTLIGIVRNWRWVRNFWFRVIHLAAIGFVVAEALLEIVCPLTVWEQKLRELGGQETYRGDFIANWVHEALFFDFPQWVFTGIYTLFGLAVLATYVFAPPRRSDRGRQREAGTNGGGSEGTRNRKR